MSDDPFLTFDAPYVLGALSPEDRHAYETHLATCDRCTQAVQELAGLPGLLARAGFDQVDEVEPPPDLLPGLLFAARRQQRRRRRITASGWVAAAACAAAVVVLAVTPSAAPTPTPAATAALAPMTPVGDAEIAGQVSLTDVAWGTKIELKCSYPGDYPPPGSYVIVVVDRAGKPERVGSWTVIPGRTSTLTASTEVPAADIERLEVQLPTGEPVLTLTA